jgi:hypothetical protein
VVSANEAVNMRFPDIAQRAFSFLEDAGFHLVQREPARLRYETDRAVVTIEWDARSGEMNVFIESQPRKDEPRDVFSLSDLLAMEDVDVPERKMPFQVTDEDRIGPFLEKLAEDTRIHAQSAITGDRMFFHRLKAFRNAQSQGYMRDLTLRHVRSEAEKAWQERALDKVTALYTSIEEELTASEKAKLDYARKYQTR